MGARASCLSMALMVASVSSEARADNLSPEASAMFRIAEVASNLQQLTDFRFLPDGRMLIAQKTGQVILRRNSGAQIVAGTVPVDPTGTNGLLGLAVDPAFDQNGFIYLYWSVSDAQGGTALARHRVSRFTLKGETLDLASERILIDQLMGEANPGGGIAIKGGALYAGVGDTGCAPGAVPGQNISNWFATCLSNGNGKILRVDLDGGIPADNPLVGQSAVTACGASCALPPNANVTALPRPEIWAWGLQNPTRLWVDPVTGRLWASDQGDVSSDELNLVAAGEHLGWPLRAGADGLDAGSCGPFTPQAATCTEPIYFCRHGAGANGVDGDCSGLRVGVIVDSCTWPAPWRGRLYFGDATGGEIAFLNLNGTRDGAADGGFGRGLLGVLSSDVPMAFEVGPDLNLYVGALGTTAPGRIIRIEPLLPETCAAPDGGIDGGGVADAGVVDAGRPPVSEGPGGGAPPAGGPPFEASGCGGCTSGVGALSAVLLLGLAAFLGRSSRRR